MTPREIRMLSLQERYSGAQANRRRGPGPAFWLDWAPMLLLGLTVALAGIARLGMAIDLSRPAPAVIVETETRTPPAVIVETGPPAGPRSVSGPAASPRRLLPS